MSMEEEQAHRYPASMREQGSAAASRRQGHGFSNDARCILCFLRFKSILVLITLACLEGCQTINA